MSFIERGFFFLLNSYRHIKLVTSTYERYISTYFTLSLNYSIIVTIFILQPIIYSIILNSNSLRKEVKIIIITIIIHYNLQLNRRISFLYAHLTKNNSLVVEFAFFCFFGWNFLQIGLINCLNMANNTLDFLHSTKPSFTKVILLYENFAKKKTAKL